MNAWHGKYVIGLTGNIATGKSVIRKMLEPLGAYGIDADSLANRITSKGSPGYQPVVDFFGTEILGEDLEIDRARLGQLVFKNQHALRALEAIVHPLVGELIDKLMTRIREEVVVLEAIKLLESGLRDRCDSLWVAHVPEEIQMLRLVEKRDLDKEVARLRVQAQPPQEWKVAAADVVIENSGTYEDLWLQVKSAWDRLPTQKTSKPGFTLGSICLQWIQPSEINEVKEWIEKLSGEGYPTLPMQGTETFMVGGWLWVLVDNKKAGLVFWNVENFIARIEKILLDPQLRDVTLQQETIHAVEQVANQLLSEWMMVAGGSDRLYFPEIFEVMGYRLASIEGLQKRAVKEALESFKQFYSIIWFKEIGVDPASLIR